MKKKEKLDGKTLKIENEIINTHSRRGTKRQRRGGKNSKLVEDNQTGKDGDTKKEKIKTGSDRTITEHDDS